MHSINLYIIYYVIHGNQWTPHRVGCSEQPTLLGVKGLNKQDMECVDIMEIEYYIACKGDEVV